MIDKHVPGKGPRPSEVHPSEVRTDGRVLRNRSRYKAFPSSDLYIAQGCRAHILDDGPKPPAVLNDYEIVEASGQA